MLIKAKLKKSDDQTDIDKYKVAQILQNIISYHIKINFPKNHNSKINAKNIKNGQSHRVTTLSIFYPTVSGIIIPSLKSIGQL